MQGAESTRGHNDVRNQTALNFREVDPTTEIEVPGLVASDPALRPADVLTKAVLPAGEVAIDVMIKSPYAQDVREDTTATGVAGKYKNYKHILHELEAIGIQYKPFVYSS